MLPVWGAVMKRESAVILTNTFHGIISDLGRRASLLVAVTLT